MGGCRCTLTALCCTRTCLSIRKPVLHLYVSVYKSTSHAVARCLVYIFLFGLFRNRCVCFAYFDKCSKHRNEPEKYFFCFVKQTEKQSKQIEFRFFSVQIDIIFCCIEDTLDRWHIAFITGNQMMMNVVLDRNHSKSVVDPDSDLDPDPEPSIIKQKNKKNLDFLCFVTSLWLFIFEEWYKCILKKQ
jgi:hypothetical protein